MTNYTDFTEQETEQIESDARELSAQLIATMISYCDALVASGVDRTMISATMTHAAFRFLGLTIAGAVRPASQDECIAIGLEMVRAGLPGLNAKFDAMRIIGSASDAPNIIVLDHPKGTA